MDGFRPPTESKPEPAIFGSEYQFVADESESTNSTSNYQTKLTLTTPILPAGNYRGEVTFEVTNDSGDKPVVTQVTLDGVPFNESFETPKFEGEFILKTSFNNRDLTNATHEIKVNFRATSEGGTAKIRNTRIEIFRVS